MALFLPLEITLEEIAQERKRFIRDAQYEHEGNMGVIRADFYYQMAMAQREYHRVLHNIEEHYREQRLKLGVS